MQQAVDEAKLENWTYTVGDPSALCALNYADVSGTNILIVIEEVFNELQYRAAFPASDYYFYISRMLMPTIPNVTTQSFSTPREGYPDGTLTVVSKP
jgi:hypothetical protein